MSSRRIVAQFSAVAIAVALAGPAAAYTIAPRDAGLTALEADGYGGFSINLFATSDSETIDSTLGSAIVAAANEWSSQITGYLSEAFAYHYATTGYVSGYEAGFDLFVRVTSIDGSKKVLAQAAGLDPYTDGDYVMPSLGLIEIDAADIAFMNDQSILEDVLLHEIAHALGFSSYYWEANGLLGGDFDYDGAYGLAAYQEEYGLGASFVPIEDSGGAGTASSHWDEALFANYGAGNNPELMTGTVAAVNTLSQTSIFSLQDLGYALGDALAWTGEFDDVTPYAAVPVPAAGGLLATALLGLGALGRRRRG